MNKDIFNKARILSKYLQNIEETPIGVFAEFRNIGIRTHLKKEGKILKGFCTCTHYTTHQAECSHILALKFWLIRNSKSDEIDINVV